MKVIPEVLYFWLGAESQVLLPPRVFQIFCITYNFHIFKMLNESCVTPTAGDGTQRHDRSVPAADRWRVLRHSIFWRTVWGSSSYLTHLSVPGFAVWLGNKWTCQSHGVLRNFRGYLPKLLVVFDILGAGVKIVSAGIALCLNLNILSSD